MTKMYFVNESMAHNAQMQAYFILNRGGDASEIFDALMERQDYRGKVSGKSFGLLKESAMAFSAYRDQKKCVEKF